MNGRFSLYLDLLRLIAASLVFLSHVPSFAGGLLWQVAGLGHEAVVVFFILSGFVMFYVVNDKRESGRQYLINRATRIYSVVLPALAITVILDGIGHWLNAEAYARADHKMQALSFIEVLVRALSFTNQSWTSASVFSNLPYWSLGYEVMYYVFFGIVMFARRAKMLLMALCLLCMGPSIVLYLPIWWGGVWLHQNKDRFQLSRVTAYIGAFGSVLGFGLIALPSHTAFIHQASMRFVLPGWLQPFILEPAGYIMVDALLAITTLVHLLCVYQLTTTMPSFNKQAVAKGITWLSSHTFAIYLLHLPMFFFVSALFPATQSPLWNAIWVLVITPLCIVGISVGIESNKHRLKSAFETLCSWRPQRDRRSAEL